MTQRDDLLVWMDLEMTSLIDPAVDSIIEIATIITDQELNIVAEGPDIVIHADLGRESIPPAVRTLHTDSGLAPLVAVSTVTESQAEAQTLAFIEEYVAPQSSPLCGNSVHMDRLFIRTRMPSILQHLHYRNIDVSTIKELAKRWQPDWYAEAQKAKENKTHRALDDIRGSIAELKFYRDRWLK